MNALSKRLCSILLCVSLLLCGFPAFAEEAQDEWTIMLYLCGTDLETDGMSATANIAEMVEAETNDEVNLVFQTGGTRQWHTQELFDGFEIANDRLQRYSYERNDIFLKDERPLANMASADTLTDFIQWSAKNYPAKKYMLVLWDHGGGGFSGIIKDELHDGSVLQMGDLAYALGQSGIRFEAIVTDACLMATVEVAQALQPYANYLVASEESVPDQGGPYAEWLQFLYDTPSCDGADAGRAYCDAIARKYAEIGADTLATITYSTIDLRKMDAVSAAFDAMFTKVGALLADPVAFNAFGYDTQHTQTFEAPEQMDLLDMARRAAPSLGDETAEAVVAAVEDAVLYSVYGRAQSHANGLAFYYATKDDVHRLDHYARVCKSAPYLAFLDAANMGWTAPDWVYEQTERLPDIRYNDYVVETEAGIGADGLPTLTVTNARHAVVTVDARVYEYDKKEKEYCALGTDVNVMGTFESGSFRYAFDGMWPAMQGRFCQMDIKDELETNTLYAIPFITSTTLEKLQRDDLHFEFRAGLVYDSDPEAVADDPDAPITGKYELYGVWNRINSADDTPSRDVWDTKDFAGEKLMLLRNYVNVYTGRAVGCLIDKTFTFQGDAPSFEEKALPTGTYAMVFIVTDVFGNDQRSAPVTISWNAKKQTATYAMME